MAKRTEVRRAAVEALQRSFPAVDVTDNLFVRFEADSDFLMVFVGEDATDPDPDLDGGARVDINLFVRTASSLPTAQDVIDERLDGVRDTLISEDFVSEVGAVSATVASYELDFEGSHAIGTAGYVFVGYEEASE